MMAEGQYLTDAKTWIDCWNGKRWEPVSEKQTTKLLEAIGNHKIAIHWRSEYVADFTLGDTEDG